jgi:peptidyl-prolyl cis-trans isomerase C
MRRESIFGILAGVMFAGAALAQDAAPDASAPPTADTVIATVDGTAITLGHLVALRATLPEQYQELPEAALLRVMLDQLIDQTLAANSLSTNPADDPVAVRLEMENARRQSLAVLALNDKMSGAVDDAQIQAEYDARYASTAGQTEYNAAHILVQSEEKAAELKSAITKGGDFRELARDNSIDKASGAQGGDLGWFAPGRMVPEFEAAVAEATPGEVVGPVETEFGWHLIRVSETRTATPPPLEAVRDQIAEGLGQEALRAVLAKMRDGAKIEIRTDEIDPAAIGDLSLIGK